MKSVVMTRHGGPEVLELTNMPILAPDKDEVLIRMTAAGVGKPDWLMRTGKYPWTKDILPFYPGLFGTGVIQSTGTSVSDLHRGQPVFVDHPIACGCYSQYKVAPAALVTPLPEGIDLVQAAAVNNHVIAWSLLKTCCGDGAGKTLYIKGAAGALGTAIVQLAPLRGISVIASASTEEKCAYLREIGADQVFCYREADEVEAVRSFTEGRGADYVLDQCVGEDFTGRFDCLNRGGTMIIYNTLNGFPKENLAQFLTDHFEKCWAIRAFSFHLHDGRTAEIRTLRDEVFSMLAAGRFTPRIGAAFPLNEIQKAHQQLDAGTTLGSIVVTME